MKKFYILFILNIVAYSLSAQKAHVEFGLKAGLNVSNIKVSTESSPVNDPRLSLHIGGLAHIHLTKHIAIQPEITFSGQGNKRTINDTVFHNNFNYINIPVLFQYMVGTGFRLETGPQFGLLATAKLKYKDYKYDLKPSYKSYDVSWAFGAGYVFESGFGFDARYNLGLSNIYAGSPATMKNNVFQLGLFYQFGAKEHDDTNAK